MMRPAVLRAPRGLSAFRIPAASALAMCLALLLAQLDGSAQAPPPDALPYTRSFLLSGNYVVGGVDVNSKMASGGFVNGSIAISGVPADADIVAATLYWETVWTTRAQLNGVKFRGEALTDIDPATGNNKITGVRETETLPLNPTTQACLGSGQGGLAIHVSEFSADVLRLLPQRLDKSDNWTGLRFANGAHDVRLPDRGTGDGAPISGGASLLIVYRDTNANPATAEPLRKIVLYEGGHAQALGATSTQTVRGFLESTGNAARVTAIGGTNHNNTTDRFRFFNERGSTVTLFTDGFRSNNGSERGWGNPTFDVSASSIGAGNAMPGGNVSSTFGEEVRLTFDHTSQTAKTYDCQTLSAIVFSAAVKDVDNDGLPDRLEDSTTEVRTPPAAGKPNGDAYPRLNLMGASSLNNHRDLFLEIGALYTNSSKTYGSASAPYTSTSTPPVISVTIGPHSHMPDREALKLIGERYAAHGISAHFDVGSVSAYLGSECTSNTNPHAVCQYLVPTAQSRGGETVLEDACNPAEPTCQFPDYPGTVGWPFGFELFRDAPVGDAGQELTTAAELQAWNDGTGANTTYRRRFDVVRRELFHYILYGHARGNPKSLPCIEDGFPAPYDPTGNTCTRPGATSNPSFRSIDYKVPSSSSGVADQPGGNVMVTVGLWDKVFGTGEPFLQASTTFHELGHNLGLSHGGPLPIPGNKATNTPTSYEANCKPNYQSSMSYLFQAHGLINTSFEQTIDYSGIALNPINETAAVDGKLWVNGTAGLYQPTWFAPAESALAFAIGATSLDGEGNLVGAATRLCNGFRLGVPPLGELQNPPTTPMARVWVKDLSASNTWDVPFDWVGNGADSTAVSANVNFDGEFQGGPTLSSSLTGFNDWNAIRLNQITAGKNLVLNSQSQVWEGSGSLWQGGGSLWQGGGSLWQGGGSLWQGGGSLWQGGGAAGGALWEGGGSLWQGGGQGGELDFEGAKGLGRTTPTAFKACILGAPVEQGGCSGSWQDNDGTVNGVQPVPFGARYHRVYTTWKKPSVGTVAGYLVFRAQGGSSAFVQICAAPGYPAPGRPACPGASDTNHVDVDELPNGVSFTYYAKALYSDDTQSQISGPSNSFTISAINTPPVALADPPVALPATYTINEEGTLAVSAPGLLFNDSDPDSPILGTAVTVVAPPVLATDTFSLSADGSFTFKPKHDFYGTVTFQYKIVPGTFAGPPAASFSGESNVAVVTIVVNPVNDPPSFTVGANQTVLEDSGPGGAHTVPGWATNILVGPAGSLAATNEFNGLCIPLVPAVCQQVVDSFEVVSNTNAALFSVLPAVAADGTLTYTLAHDMNGTATIEVRAHDTGGTALGGFNFSATQSFTITVQEVNDPPVPVADPAKEMFEDCSPTAASSCATPLSFPAADLSGNDGKGGGADENGQTLTVTAVTPGATTHGTVALSAPGGNITYTPEPNYNGVATFTYTVCDNGTTAGALDTQCAIGTVTVNITPVNDPPVVTDQSATTTQHSAVPTTLLATDVDGDPLTFTIVDNPTDGTLSGTSPGLTYTPGAPFADFAGVDTFTFKVTDGLLESGVATFTVTVNPTGPATFVVRNTNDSGIRSLRQAITNANANVNASPDTIAFGIPGSGVQTIVPLTELPALADPVIVDGRTQTGYAGTPLVELSGASVGATANGLRLTTATSHEVRGLSIFGFGGHGIYVDHTGSAPTTIVGNFIGLRGDGTAAAGSGSGIGLTESGATIGGATTADRNIIGANANSGVVLSNSGSTYSTLVQGNYIGTDPTGMLARHNDFGVTIGSAPGVRVIGNLISGNRVGVYVLGSSHPAIDGSYNSVIQGNTIGRNSADAVLQNNDAGVLLTNSNNLVGGTLSGQGNVISGNGAAGVEVTNSDAVRGNRVLGNRIYDNGDLGIDLILGGVLGVTPNDAGDGDPGPNGLQNFPDLTLAYARLSATIVAGNLNSTPGTTFRIEVFSNVSCDPSGYGEGQQLVGAADVTTNTTGDAPFRFTLSTYAGAGSQLTATATDPSGNTSEFSHCKIVTPNMPPTADTASASTNEDIDLPIVLTGADPDGDAITFTIVDIPDHGMLSGLAPNLTYHPAANFNGSDSFTFYTSDGELNSVVRTVSIGIAPVNDNPAGNNDSATTRLNAPVTISVLANDTDVDLDSLTVSGVTTAPLHGTASPDSTNTMVIYTPNTDFAGSDEFVYSISDGQGGSGTGHVSVTVQHVGSGPAMALARRFHSATLLDSGKVLIAGGEGVGGALGSGELYDSTVNSFSSAGSQVVPRAAHVAVKLDGGTVLIAGGWNGTTQVSSAEIYDPSAATSFSATGSMAKTRQSAAAVKLNDGRVLVTGGIGTGLNNAEIYASGTFGSPISMIHGRYHHTATLLPGSGKVLIVGGVNTLNESIAEAELFDPGTNTFTAIGSLLTARHGHTAVLLNNGKVLIAGGVSCVPNCSTSALLLDSAELYDPDAGTFSSAGTMTTGRSQFTATDLADGSGRVLLAGGLGEVGSTATVEIYDPAAASFTAVDGLLSDGRYSHTATRLADGRILITGGGGVSASYVNTTDIYKP